MLTLLLLIGPLLDSLMEQMRNEFASNPPLPGSYIPKKGDLCAAKFVDGEWLEFYIVNCLILIMPPL